MRRRETWNLVVLILLFAAPGCETPPLDFLEVVRVREPLSDADVKKFLRIVHTLPGQQLPSMTPAFLGPPEWAESRTLPVGDLAIEEREHLQERWRPSRLAGEWSGHRALQRVLLRERMTVEQFAGLTLSLGAAFSRSSLPEDTDLRFLLEKGDRQTDHLKRDRRSFASLPEDDRHLVLLQAMWITRRHRAFLLLEVPPENLDLVARHRESLAAVLPEEFQKPAFEGITDRLEEQGLPFEELSSSGRDEELDWRKEDAIIGTDLPDGERGE